MENHNKENRRMLMSSRVLKPSPNEEEAILKGVIAERKKQRLIQVRKQQKKLSGEVLNAVKSKQAKEVNSLKMQLQDEWERKVFSELQDLEREYENRLKTLGEGHKSVSQVPVKDMSKSEELMNQRAKDRHQEALRKLAEQRASLRMMVDEKSKLRLRVAAEEQARAAMVASKPAPAPDFILKPESKIRGSTISSKSKSIESFSSTRFHMPVVYAEKADQTTKVDAREAAKKHEERVSQERELLDKDLNERKEKANLRHQHARQQVLLDQSKDRLMMQLEDLEFKDRVRRQQVLANIPKQVFQPPYQRLEDARSRQVMLEEAFENAHMPKQETRKEELRLDLDSHLDVTETDFSQPTGNADEDEVAESKESADLSPESHARLPDETEFDKSENTSSREPAQQTGAESSKKVPKDPTSRMQKLMSRIRKQQEEWTKQKANRETQVSSNVDSQDENGQFEDDSETTGSLVSADIESARFASSNGESAPDEKDGQETAQPPEHPKEDSSPSKPENESLLHPFEKAKLVRSTNTKESSVANVKQDSEVLSDVTKRKKTLENQKYLLKIQKQRLENELLRQNLQQTGKELDDLIKQDDESSGTLEVVVDVSADITSSSSQGIEEISPVNERNSATNSTQKTFLTSKDFSFLNGLSASQQKVLVKRYPNIFSGFLTDDTTFADSRDDNATLALVHSSVESTNVQRPTTSIANPPRQKDNMRLSKSRVDHERIRKYQEQLLQKQRWLKSRQEVMQKRFTSHGKDLGRVEEKRPVGQEDVGKHGDDVATEVSKAKDVAEATAWPKTSTMSGLPVQDNLTEEARYYPLKDSNTVEEEGGRAEIQRRQIEADFYKADTEATVNELATLLSQSSSLNKRQSVYEQLQALRSMGDVEQKSLRQTNSFVELIPQTARSGGQNGIEENYIGRNMSSRSQDLPAPRASVTLPESKAFVESRHHIEDAPKQSNVDDLLNSMDFLTVDEPSEFLHSHVSKTLENPVKKSQRIVSGKPTFSPIQEVEETSFREKSLDNKVVQGTASVSSLTEQELPMSMKSSSGHSHSSLRSSGASGGKSDVSSALSFHELISNFSETEFLTLPTALRAVSTRPIEEATLASRSQPGSSTRELPLANLQSSFDNWTPLVADYSEVGKDDKRIEESKDTRDNRDFADGKNPSKFQDLFAFDKEKYRRIIQEKLPADFLSNGEKQSDQARNYQPSNGGIDIFSPVKLQGIIERISASNVHALPPSDSRRVEHQDKKISNSNYESSMRETSPVLTENSPSSSVTSKVSSTNMTRYEEILAKVRMLPHQHQEEYNRLAESYRSWRKEAVEPLLHPDVPDPFAGYELFSVKDKSEPALQEADKVKIEHTGGKPQSENLLGTILKTKNTSPERLQDRRSLVASLGESRISVYEPVRGIELPEAAVREKATVEEDKNEPQTWRISDFIGTGSLPDAWDYNKATFYGENEASLVPSEGDNSPDYSNENYIEIPGAFVADHLMEQKLFESTDFENSPTSSRTRALASDKEEVVEISRIEIENKVSSMNGGGSFIENTMLDSQDRGDQIDKVPGIQTSPADPVDIEALQKQYLDNYLSTLIESSATKSSFTTNSSSQKTRSQFSSEFRSDETVSELVRLWPSSSKTIIEEAEASQASTAISGPDQLHASSVASGSRPGVNFSDSFGAISSGFKDPNHYDITVHRSRQTKSEKTTISGNSSKSASFKDETDSNFSMPSFPRFASTRLEKGGRPTSPSLSETSLEPTGDNGLDMSVLSNFDYDADVGHSETSWLLSSDNVKGDVSHVSDIRHAGPAFTQDGLIDDSNKSSFSGSSVEKQDHASEPEGSTKLDLSYENSSDDVISTWDDLLAKEAPLSSAKESDSDLADTVRLKRDAFMKRSRERLHKIKEKAVSRERKADKFRIDGKVEKSFKAENRENKEPARRQKTPKIPSGVIGVREKKRAQDKGNIQDTSRAQVSAKQPERRKKPTKQEVLQENRRKMKQFEKKIQSSLRSRRK